MASETIAALDLGSNTFRLMLAEKKGRSWAEKKVFQHIPRLSENLTNGGRFAPDALTRAWSALNDFGDRVNQAAPSRVLAGATMAARLAADGPQFIEHIEKKFGWEALILSGQDEARLTATGVLSGLAPLPDKSLIFDIGGRSTEFISTRTTTLIKSRSLAVGVVGLTEKYLVDPIEPGQLSALARDCRETLGSADFSDVEPGSVLVGTAGTVTTIAALLLGLGEYQPELVNNSRLGRADISTLLDSLTPMTVAERVEKYGLHPRRADAIVAGLVLALEIMDHFQTAELMVSDNGLLEGIWLMAAGLIPRP